VAGQKKIKNAAVFLIRLFVGGLFVYAGLLKALDPHQLLADIQGYRLLPYIPAVMLAFYLPYLEIVCGAALFIRKNEQGALVLLLGCTGLFLVALVSAWARGLDISCGCFGGGNHAPQFLRWVLRDLLVAGLVAVLLNQSGASSRRRS